MSWYGSVSFHGQQAAEKSLKALLVRHEISFPNTHNVEQLLQLARPAAPGLDERLAGARTLTPYAVRLRYPGEGPLPDREAARGHLDLAKKVLEEVRSFLAPYLDAGPPGT